MGLFSFSKHDHIGRFDIRGGVLVDYTEPHFGDGTTVRVPARVREIGDIAFNRCRKLREIILPDGVETIGSGAFSLCSDLRAARLGTHLRTIGTSAFANCLFLRDITLPDTVESIGDHAFNSCRQMEGMHLPAALRSIGSHAFYACHALTQLEVPPGVTTLGDNCFSQCNHVEQFVLPAELENCGRSIMTDCGESVCLKIYHRDDPYKRFAFTLQGQYPYGGFENVLRTLLRREYMKHENALYYQMVLIQMAANGYAPEAAEHIGLHHLLSENETGALTMLADVGILITAESIDDLIRLCIEEEWYESQMFLMDMKEKRFGYQSFESYYQL